MSWFTWLYNWLFGSTETPLVKAIREKTVELCGFLPTIETVVALVAVHPAMVTAVVVAKKICVAVTKSYAVAKIHGGGELEPMVDGVIIEGEFVNKE